MEIFANPTLGFQVSYTLRPEESVRPHLDGAVEACQKLLQICNFNGPPRLRVFILFHKGKTVEPYTAGPFWNRKTIPMRQYPGSLRIFIEWRGSETEFPVVNLAGWMPSVNDFDRVGFQKVKNPRAFPQHADLPDRFRQASPGLFVAEEGLRA